MSNSSMRMETESWIGARTDKYFWRSKKIIDNEGDVQVTYAYFIRRDVIAALQPAIDFLTEKDYELNYDRNRFTIKRFFPEGALVPSESKLMEVTGSFSDLVMLETLILQKVGFACVSAYNAYKMSMAMPDVSFMDMHARHGTGSDMNHLATYGASVGSKTAQMLGAKGFVGGAQDITAHYFGQMHGMGTMPHAIVGYAKLKYPTMNSMVAAVKMYFDAMPEEKNAIALVDYDGKEITDALAVANWMRDEGMFTEGKRLGIRLDTHGGRFAEGLDYAKSVDIVCKWLHAKDEYEAVRKVMGEEAYDMDTLNIHKDKVRKILFGTGVSAANIINMRKKLNKAGFENVFIVASSGFNLFKCRVMSAAKVPVDMIGTGSFLPEKLSETYTTADIIRYNDLESVKVGREWLLA